MQYVDNFTCNSNYKVYNNSMARKAGKIKQDQEYLLEVRNSYIKYLTKSFNKKEVSIIFNLNPSQITRINKK